MRGDELNESLFDGYDCLYIEGYLVQDHELIGRAVRLAKACGLTVALDLASFNIVDENLGFLNELTDGYVDVLFANEQEAFSFTGERNPLEALDKISRKCPLAVVKVGMQGAYIKHRGKVDHVGIMAEAKRVDTTGAGDFYAAGFLVGLTRGLSMVQCGTIGAIGGRPRNRSDRHDVRGRDMDRNRPTDPAGRSRRLSVLTLRSARLAVPRKITERYP